MKRLTYGLTYLVLMAVPAGLLALLVDGLDWRSLIVVILIGFLIGGVFDIWATRKGKKDKFFIWEYSRKTTLGYAWWGVPVEDFILFLVLTPALIVVAWEVVKKLAIAELFPWWGWIGGGGIVLGGVFNLAARLSRKK